MMRRYEYKGLVLSTNLNKDYDILAMYGKPDENNNYSISLYLYNIDTDMTMKLNESFELNIPDKNMLSRTIMAEIDKMVTDNFFDKYIDDFNYFLECMTYGDRHMNLGVKYDG